MARLSVKPVTKKLMELHGNISATAQAFAVSRSGMVQFIDRHNLGHVVEEAREATVDIAETALKRAVLNGEAWAIALTLKTIGKKRGYVERTETEQSGVTEIVIRRVNKVDGSDNA